ncbi:hypothetical protein [Mesorhizobium australicum]|uniref:hypothetical protein n=1 Tax=Mesorhizobium australicum TaxID=536018 RepID=UPI0033374906
MTRIISFLCGMLLMLLSLSGTGRADTVISVGQLDDWVHQLNDLQGQTSPERFASQSVDLLARLNDWLSSVDAVYFFRQWSKDDEVVKDLIPLAAGDVPEARIQATLVLGNVVDNTNVCYVISYIEAGKGLSVNGRFNLLQVVLQVANYPLADTGVWISDMANQLLKKVSAEENMEKTVNLLLKIRQTLADPKFSSSGSLRTLAPGKFTACQDELNKVKSFN